MATVDNLQTLQKVRESFQGWEKDLRSYLEHDLGNYVVPLMAAYRAVSGEQLTLGRVDLKDQGEIYQQIIKQLEQFDPQSAPPSLAGLLRMTSHMIGIMPALVGSIAFLNDPTEEGYKKLQEKSVPLQSVLRVAGADIISPVNARINAPRTIMALNLMHNGQRHGIDGRFNVDICDDNLQVRNVSKNRLPENLFELGVNEAGDLQRVGSFITAMYARLENIPLSLRQEALPRSYRTGDIRTWDITFGFPIAASPEAFRPFNVIPLQSFEPLPLKPS